MIDKEDVAEAIQLLEQAAASTGEARDESWFRAWVQLVMAGLMAGVEPNPDEILSDAMVSALRRAQEQGALSTEEMERGLGYVATILGAAA